MSVALGRVDVVQPVLWAVMVSLAELWRSYGVVPSAVVGHAQGEIAAACVAGGLSLADGARVVALRSEALLALSGRGGDGVRPRARRPACGTARGLSVAAVERPGVHGGVRCRSRSWTRCSRSSRRPSGFRWTTPRTPRRWSRSEGSWRRPWRRSEPRAPGRFAFHSTVTGRAHRTPAQLDAGYWYRNLRAHRGVPDHPRGPAGAQGHTVFVEASPHPVLTRRRPGHRRRRRRPHRARRPDRCAATDGG
ncbi:acyltransferase domain-containing protein, partial [Streptomyces sp. Mo3]|uniref:acyltransferase domain-containing protein n=1 Tax=Streptomyces sp. Mo3 TaxID=3161190 RepID=UPI0039F08F57